MDGRTDAHERPSSACANEFVLLPVSVAGAARGMMAREAGAGMLRQDQLLSSRSRQAARSVVIFSFLNAPIPSYPPPQAPNH